MEVYTSQCSWVIPFLLMVVRSVDNITTLFHLQLGRRMQRRTLLKEVHVTARSLGVSNFTVNALQQKDFVRDATVLIVVTLLRLVRFVKKQSRTHARKILKHLRIDLL